MQMENSCGPSDRPCPSRRPEEEGQRESWVPVHANLSRSGSFHVPVNENGIVNDHVNHGLSSGVHVGRAYGNDHRQVGWNRGNPVGNHWNCVNQIDVDPDVVVPGDVGMCLPNGRAPYRYGTSGVKRDVDHPQMMMGW